MDAEPEERSGRRVLLDVGADDLVPTATDDALHRFLLSAMMVGKTAACRRRRRRQFMSIVRTAPP